MELYIEEARYLLTILLVMIGLAEVEPRVYGTCHGSFRSVINCYDSRSAKCCSDRGFSSRCCSPTTCGVYGSCTTWSKRSCCPPAYSYGSSTCCNTWSYSFYKSSSSRSSWSSYSKSRASSRSSSASSYSSSVNKRREREQERSDRNGILAGSIVGGIVFMIFAVVIPVVLCRNAAARSYQGRVIALAQQGQQQGQYAGGPQIAGVIPNQTGQFQTPATAPTVEYRPPYYQGQQYPPPTNPVYQPSAPTEMPAVGQHQPSSAPPPTYDAAVALLQKT